MPEECVPGFAEAVLMCIQKACVYRRSSFTAHRDSMASFVLEGKHSQRRPSNMAFSNAKAPLALHLM